MGQQSIIITDGITDIQATTGTPVGTEQGLITRSFLYGTDGTTQHQLLTDGYGKLLFGGSLTISDNDAANPNSALPAQTSWMGASDGTNLQGLLVESASNLNLRVGLFFGATEAKIGATNSASGNALNVLTAQYHQTLTAVSDTNLTFLQTDGYGRLETTCARAVAFKYENATNQTTTLKTGAGVLRRVIVGNAGATGALVTFYDNTVGSGTVIAKVNSANILGELQFDISYSTGLTYTTNAKTPGDITITYE